MQVEKKYFLSQSEKGDSHLLSTTRIKIETIHYQINGLSDCVDGTSGIYDFMTTLIAINYMMAVRGNSHRLVASVLRRIENNIDSKIISIPKQSPSHTDGNLFQSSFTHITWSLRRQMSLLTLFYGFKKSPLKTLT